AQDRSAGRARLDPCRKGPARVSGLINDLGGDVNRGTQPIDVQSVAKPADVDAGRAIDGIKEVVRVIDGAVQPGAGPIVDDDEALPQRSTGDRVIAQVLDVVEGIGSDGCRVGSGQLERAGVDDGRAVVRVRARQRLYAAAALHQLQVACDHSRESTCR